MFSLTPYLVSLAEEIVPKIIAVKGSHFAIG